MGAVYWVLQGIRKRDFGLMKRYREGLCAEITEYFICYDRKLLSDP